MRSKMLNHLDLIRNTIWYEEGWYLTHMMNYRKEEITMILQHPPCSGKKPSYHDRYEKRIMTHHRMQPDYPTWYHALGDGNPGAMDVVKQMEQKLQWHDYPGGIEVDEPSDIFVFLYANEIVGPELWKLYKDNLDKDVEQLILNVHSATMADKLHCSPDNYLINPDMPRREIQRDPLNRSPGPPERG